MAKKTYIIASSDHGRVAALSAALAQCLDGARIVTRPSVRTAMARTGADTHVLLTDAPTLAAADAATLAALRAARGALSPILLTDGPTPPGPIGAAAADDDLDAAPNFETLCVETLEWRDLAPDALRKTISRALRVAELHARLSQQSEEISRFSRILAHDLGAPVGSIQRLLGLSSAALESAQTNRIDTARDGVARALTAARRIGALLSMLERRAALGSESESRFGPLDAPARAAAARLERERATLGDSRTVELRVSALPPAAHRPTQMEELFLQLMRNATLFNVSDGPVVTVEGRREGDRIEITVADNGLGVPDAHLDEIFEPLVRLHGPQAFPGSGMGLTLCRSVALEMGGRIWFDRGVANGARVRLSLPANRSPSGPLAAAIRADADADADDEIDADGDDDEP